MSPMPAMYLDRIQLPITPILFQLHVLFFFYRLQIRERDGERKREDVRM